MAKLLRISHRLSLPVPEPTPTSHILHTMGVAYDTFVATAPGVTPVGGIADTWTNNLGYNIFIKQAEIWIGVQGKAVVDIPYRLLNLTANETIISSGEDHYTDQGTAMGRDYDTPYFGDEHYLVMQGDILELWVQAVDYNVTPEYVSAAASFRFVK